MVMGRRESIRGVCCGQADRKERRGVEVHANRASHAAFRRQEHLLYLSCVDSAQRAWAKERAHDSSLAH